MNVKHWGATRILAAGFALMILLGGALLCLPIANRGGTGISFLNALFTATSATCVTGLVVFDTWTQFSLFGQAVILLLIQIGGLGFITVAILFSLAIGRRIGLRERSLLAEAVSSTQVGGVVRLVRRTLIGTAMIEGAGAVLLAIRFVPLFGVKRGIWFGIFHSVSAFCNAGFDLMGIREPLSSLVHFSSDPLVVLTIGFLIIIGGIGFVVWNDLVETRFHPGKLKLHSRAVLISTLGLILGGALLVWLFERNGVLVGMSAGSQALNAFFQSVTPRTAGFNTVDMASMSDGGKLVTMLLMFIGAAPGSTGGGVKVTTLAVVAATVIASLRNREDVSLWHFRIDAETLRHAYSSMAIYLALTVGGVLILCAGGAALTAAAFECLSAIGTVGLTTGITAGLPPVSKGVLIALMYAGRVGSVTVFLAVARSSVGAKLKNPVGKVIIG
jgi:trk system potassium uptake protein TrkH